MSQTSSFDFAAASAALLGSARAGRISISDFEAIVPAIASQIRQDKSSCVLPLWGKSSNMDEVANQRIVDPKILSTIGRLANTKIGGKSIYHAGLMHTYGYLFSTVQTPYGFKRDRWVSSKIESGLGLPKHTISPLPSSGTLFSNVSFLLAQIAGRGTKEFASKKSWAEKGFNQRLLDFDVEDFKGLRIVESLTGPSGKKEYDFHSDIIQFKTKDLIDESLLVYSIQVRGAIRKLYTCFPIQNETRNELVKLAKRNAGAIDARYNAVIESTQNGRLIGSSQIIDF